MSELAELLTSWRHQLHSHPETAFEEVETAAFVAEKLKEMGLEVYTGIGKTGVVGLLKAGDGKKRSPSVRTWMRSTCRRQATRPTSLGARARCMAAVMTATPRPCSVRQRS